MVAGNGESFPYTHDPTPGLTYAETEFFPLDLLPGVLIKHWDRNPQAGVRPFPAVFVPLVNGNTSQFSCFRFNGLDVSTVQTGIDAYINFYPVGLLDTNQGVQIQKFGKGIDIHDLNSPSGSPGFNVILRGISVSDCGQGLVVDIKNTLGSILRLSRTRMRTDGGVLFSSLPLIDVSYEAANFSAVTSTFNFSLDRADLRPGEHGMGSSMVVFRGWSSDNGDDTLDVSLLNVLITGQAEGAVPVPGSPPPPPAQVIGQAGIEIGLKLNCQGRFNLRNVTVQNAQGDGLFGYVNGTNATGPNTTASLTMSNCNFEGNGSAGTPDSFLLNQGFPGADLLESGLHLMVFDGGRWSIPQARESNFNYNYRHGVFLQSGASARKTDGFGADFDLCTFFENGASVDPSETGHGFTSIMNGGQFHAGIHRSALSGNSSSGFHLSLENPGVVVGTTADHSLKITNSTISRNQGNGTLVSPSPVGVNAISVFSRTDMNQFEIELSQNTVSNNASPYAVALIGLNQLAQDGLFVGTSSVDNCVLNKNGGSVGGMPTDQAFFPDPSVNSGSNFNTIYSNTHHCNLGTDGLTAYYSGSGNFFVDPQLTPFSFMGFSLGNVFPGTGGPVVNQGSNPRAATEDTDNRGPGFPRWLDPQQTYDVGAFEVQ